MDYTIFKGRLDVKAYDCTRGCTDTELKVDFQRKIPCRSGESKLLERRAGATVYQLSYIPAVIWTGFIRFEGTFSYPPTLNFKGTSGEEASRTLEIKIEYRIDPW